MAEEGLFSDSSFSSLNGYADNKAEDIPSIDTTQENILVREFEKQMQNEAAAELDQS